VEWVHRAFILLPEARTRAFTEYYLRHRRAARELTGLPFDLPAVGAPYPASSMPALEAAAWVKAHAPRQFPAYDLALYQAFFQETRDISDLAVLGALAADLGLNRDGLERALETGERRSAVWTSYQEAQSAGVSAIPTVQIGAARISGAVSYEEYLRAARASLAAGEPASVERAA